MEYTSEVETRETHYEDAKEMVVNQLYRSPLLLSSKSDKDR